MRMKGWLATMGVVTLAAATMLSAGPALAAPAHSIGSINCKGGEIDSGAYSNLTVTGACSVAPGAVIAVTGDITVAKGAGLDAQSAPSTIIVDHNVTALSGAFLGLGCQPGGESFHACTGDAAGSSAITVKGNITALNSATVLLNGLTVRGSITALGGGSDIPWSIKHNNVTGSVTVAGQTTNWVGVIFNQVGGNVTLLSVAITDSDGSGDGAFVAQNKITHNLICFGVTPTVSGTVYPDEPLNSVGGRALGQCAALAA